MRFLSFFVCLNLLQLSASLFSQAKFEPPTGKYFGAFVMNEASIGGSIQKFDSIAGKRHTSYFSYAAWGQPFPQWAFDYAAGNRTVQIAFEPSTGLGDVVDGDYIRTWARTAKKINAPVFLRFASEMNGNWVPWYGTPDLYKQKFRLLYTIMKEEAPNVALVWCPNDVPNDTLSGTNNPYVYYPGDAYTDWVGIDFYGVYFYENGTPERKDPREKLRVVYNKYAATKPIMICEWAVAHYTSRVTPAQDCTPYALAQMDSLYSGSVAFPQLKSVNWFSWNTLSINKSNYSLLENEQVLAKYKSLISRNHFVSVPYINVPLISYTSPLFQDTVVGNSFSVRANVRCDLPVDSIVVEFPAFGYYITQTNTLAVNISTLTIPDGVHTLKVKAYSGNGKFSNFETRRIIVNNNNNYNNIITDDTTAPGFSTTGNWSLSNSQPDRYGAYYHVSPASAGTSRALWKITIPVAGYYNIYAFWSQHSNRSNAVPYIISSGGKTDTVIVSQREMGGRWNSLLTRFLPAGITEISVVSSSAGYTVADAVRAEWAFIDEIENNEFKESQISVTLSAYPLPFTNSIKLHCNIMRQFFATYSLYSITGEELSKDEILFNNGSTQISGTILNNLSPGVFILKLQLNLQSKPIYLKLMKK